jgi:hypothetical protein
MRVSTNQVTLTTWTLRVDGQDVTDLNLTTIAHVSAARDMVADVTGQRVSLHLTANQRGTLLDLIAARDGAENCSGTTTVRVGN